MLRLRVPATSANLGPGFDCLGLALDLWLEVTARPAERDRFVYLGDGHVPDGPDNLVHEGLRRAFAALGRPPPAVAIEARNPIPLARGLGSSSAALVAGAALADAWSGGALGRDGVFQLTADLEGHPDNVAPAVYGGFTVSAARLEGGYATAMLEVPPRWRLLFGVPAYGLPTERARAALPAKVPREDAVRTASRAALWVLAVTHDRPELLRTASLDVLHEPYREHLVPGLGTARAALRAAGAHAAFLSGAGPTVGAVVDAAHEEACRTVLADYAGAQGRVLSLGAAGGYRVEDAAAGGPAATARRASP